MLHDESTTLEFVAGFSAIDLLLINASASKIMKTISYIDKEMGYDEEDYGIIAKLQQIIFQRKTLLRSHWHKCLTLI